MAKQKHDPGVRKRKLNELLNPEPLTREERRLKRQRERLGRKGNRRNIFV